MIEKTQIYISEARVLAKAFSKYTGSLLVRCLVPKNGITWDETYTVDIRAKGRLAEVMRDNITYLQCISFHALLPKGDELLQGQILDIKRIRFGEHKGVQRQVKDMFTDIESGLWLAQNDSRKIEQDIVRMFRDHEYDPEAAEHNSTGIVDNDLDALDYLYGKFNIQPDRIGAVLWSKDDNSEAVYHVQKRC